MRMVPFVSARRWMIVALTASQSSRLLYPAMCFSTASSPFVLQPTSLRTKTCFLPRALLPLRGGSSTTGGTTATGGGVIAQSSTPTTCLSLSTSATTNTQEESATVEMGGDNKMDAATKLEGVRSKMLEMNLDVYLVPTDDPHLSEYVPKAYMRRAFLTDFHGSAGTAVVTPESGLLWTDSRYWNEASLQLDSSCWKLMKSGDSKVDTIPTHLAKMAVEHFRQHSKPLRVGFDPFVHAASYPKELMDAAKELAQKELDNHDDEIDILQLETPSENIVDSVWGEDRPPVPTSPFRVHPLEYAGKSVAEKVAMIRTEMEEKKATLAVFCTLDDVAYLFNMRAMGDVETCPVGIAYGSVSADQVTLYCDSKKVESVQEHLQDVTIKSYDDIVDDIVQHCQLETTNKVWVDRKRANYAISNVIPEKQLIDKQNAVTPMKACKNQAEMAGMRRAHEVDGAAMAKFMAWLEHTIVEEGKAVSEVEIDLKLTGFRAEQPGFMEVSFPTIAGVGSNGAIIHYRATEGTDLLKHMDKTTPILIDSGGQYTYGTTDVTRTWHFGTPTPEFIDTYTRVLKGNIGVDTMVFPENLPGFVLDVFARKALWEAGKDYGHGTGHGVGAALNVHEGPMSISPRWANKEGLKKGMVVSNEPGYYEDGNFGIRIENLLEIAFVKPEHEEEKEDEASSEKKYLKFNRLTMIPIQKSLINTAIMTEAELDWLDAYHQEVFAKVSPLLEAGSDALQWLEKMCEKIDRNP